MNNTIDRISESSEHWAIRREAWRLGELSKSEKIEESEEGKMLLDAGLDDEEKDIARYWFSAGFRLKEYANA